MAFVGCLSSEQQFVLEEGDIKDEKGGWAVHVKNVNRYGGDNKSATEDKDLSTNLKLKDGKSMQHIKQKESPKVEQGCLAQHQPCRTPLSDGCRNPWMPTINY